MPRTTAAPALALCGLIAAVLMVGCGPPPAQPASPPAPRSGGYIDPCAQRLHDISGGLLLYYATRRALPTTLSALKDHGAVQLPPLVCPVSKKPYLYNPRGLVIPGRAGRLVLYDAEASHSGMRWGIMVTPPAGGMIATDVRLLPEGAIPRKAK